ncbi:MAG: spermidine/putrescine ABC transporter substrate-binding protein [Nocardioidaceae bacterium]|nr:spermidine/putrescine ABC transporter substrate-binding protein [Nocardioidaceae bacterium]
MRSPLPAPRPTSGRLTRRGLLAGLGAAGVAGCSGGGSGERAPGSVSPTAGSSLATSPTVRADGPITWANWPAYIARSTLRDFQQESGISVDYQTPINDNVEFLGVVGDQLAAGDPIGFDVITMTSWVTAQLIDEGALQPFGPVAGAERVIPSLATPNWDPEQRFSMPWQAGLTGIAYDARRVDRAIGSIAELFDRQDLAGGVGMLTELSDTLGMVLLGQGHDLTDLSEDDLNESMDFLGQLAESGQFAGFYGNDYLKGLRKGTLAASLAWSGDVLQEQLKNPYLKFVVPEEGLLIWSDDLLVPRGSEQAGAVARLAEYYYQPEVAARLAAWVNYICPVQGAQEAMEKVAPELVDNPLIFPDGSINEVSYQFPNLPGDLFERASTRFNQLAQV